jgi:hypothetical protein
MIGGGLGVLQPVEQRFERRQMLNWLRVSEGGQISL